MPDIIGLIGNPNSGKSTLFNALTGLNQKVGNFPGVTVDRKSSTLDLQGTQARIIDFPGAYSLYPNAQDERIVANTLANPTDESFPDLIVYVANIHQLEKHFLLLSQLIDLKIPLILTLNLADEEAPESAIDSTALSDWLGIPVLKISARMQQNLDQLKSIIARVLKNPEEGLSHQSFLQQDNRTALLPAELQNDLARKTTYQSNLLLHHHDWILGINTAQKQTIAKHLAQSTIDKLGLQVQETLGRFDQFAPKLKSFRKAKQKNQDTFSDKADSVLTHFIAGPIIFALLMLFVFQSIFTWAGIPMEMIENIFSTLKGWSSYALGQGWLLSLVNDGLLSGLEGVLIFIPQIAILFFLIGILEESGYMSRAIYLFDGLMARFGMNGRSIVALVSSGACAIPAIMSTRTISNQKERLITILVSPFISCSARIPVYAILIALVIPATTIGIFNLQGLVFMGLYLLGVLAALISAWIFKKILKSNERSFLLLELPPYRMPSWRNVLTTTLQKVWAFIWEAGRIIMVISVILWVMANFSYGDQMAIAETKAITEAKQLNLTPDDTENLIASNRLEHSFAGIAGKTIEPLIRPLGMDWKMGIALITSFAAREVFVGTMGTIYSLGESDELSLREHMAKETNPRTGLPSYTLATGLSLLIFYVFAMQCMSTLAVVKRETDSWFWPILQFIFMGAVAYLGSFLVYQILS